MKKQPLQSRTSQVDYKSENEKLINEVSELSNQITAFSLTVSNDAKTIENLENQAKAKDNTINQLKKDNTAQRAEITELKRVASVDRKYLEQVEKERDAKKNLLGQANEKNINLGNKLTETHNSLSELQAKWYVKMFNAIGL